MEAEAEAEAATNVLVAAATFLSIPAVVVAGSVFWVKVRMAPAEQPELEVLRLEKAVAEGLVAQRAALQQTLAEPVVVGVMGVYMAAVVAAVSLAVLLQAVLMAQAVR